MSTVLFTPALPAIARYFSVSSGTAQLAVTFFLVGFAIGQLPYGPLSNRFGRKPLLYSGLVLAAVASIVCVFAGYMHFFWLLIAARFFMALGASAGLKIVYTMVGDTEQEMGKSATIFTYIILAYAIAPGVATSIGGFLMQYFNWQSCFYFLAAYSLFLLLFSTRLPETSTKREEGP